MWEDAIHRVPTAHPRFLTQKDAHPLLVKIQQALHADSRLLNKEKNSEIKTEALPVPRPSRPKPATPPAERSSIRSSC